VGRLNGTVKRKELLDMFAKCGEIVDMLMKEDFAFVEYMKADSAQLAIRELNGKSLGSARIVVEEARPRMEEGKP
jgi:RNA recognition motif-containing protein